jgi:hypothetical protein
VISAVFFVSRTIIAQEADIEIVTSSQKLEDAFNWAKDQARAYVQTGKSGVLNQTENANGTGDVDYIPSYWAGYPSRTAFYIRDFAHQAAGAHLLGLQLENLTMLKNFAGTANANRKWYPLWALNFDGSDYLLDYRGDDDFVREVPAVFELVELGYRQYLWTADPEYLNHPQLWKYYTKAVTDFIGLHDTLIPDRVAEGNGSGDIFQGTATYNEQSSHVPLIESGDGIASQYQALLAYAEMLKFKRKRSEAAVYRQKAAGLKKFFNEVWGVQDNEINYVRGYDNTGQSQTDFGLEGSWFIPMKFISEPSGKHEAYLDFIAANIDDPKTRPGNIEALSYIPGTFFSYNRVEFGWKWMEYIIDQEDKTYPEISYVMIENVVQGLIGFQPNAPGHACATVPRLPDGINTLGVRNIQLGTHRIDVVHEGLTKTTLTHTSGDELLEWEAQFYGNHETISVNGEPQFAKQKRLNGVPISYISIPIEPKQKSSAAITLPL